MLPNRRYSAKSCTSSGQPFEEPLEANRVTHPRLPFSEERDIIIVWQFQIELKLVPKSRRFLLQTILTNETAEKRGDLIIIGGNCVLGVQVISGVSYRPIIGEAAANNYSNEE